MITAAVKHQPLGRGTLSPPQTGVKQATPLGGGSHLLCHWDRSLL